jgi:tetratricopeptide (TPR) repeat protein
MRFEERALSAASVLFLALAATPAQPARAVQLDDDPDQLYADREQPGNAARAAAIWEAAIKANPRDYEAAWKLARACYWLGGHLPPREGRRQLERGVNAARHAVDADPRRPEGHYWMAADMGALAESFGLTAGLRYRGAIKEELETVLAIDPAYLQGSADRALGRWYAKVPGLFGGSRDRALDHLHRALRYSPNSTVTHFFLAEVLIDMKRLAEARGALEAVLAAPLDPDWTPEDREFKAKATALIDSLSASR